MKKSRGAEQMCQSRDRHHAGLVCGYPLPCPHHTVLVIIDDRSTPKRRTRRKR